jgi:CheY-like chemotaxis protein
VEKQSTLNNKQGEWQQVNTVLVVDDDDNWCFVAKKLLKREGVGKEVITASNGLNALQKLQAITANGGKLPELIFLDIKMPVMNGFEFLDEVTKLEELDLSQTRIYVCSSSVNSKDKEKADLYPVAGYIPKPLTQEILRDILH